MKKTQAGFIGIALVILISLAIVGGGAYVYLGKKAKVSESSMRAVKNSNVSTQDNTAVKTDVQTNTTAQVQPTVSASVNSDAYISNGTYEFSEFAAGNEPGSNQTWVYALNVMGDKATVNVDGFQTLIRLNAVLNKKGNSTQVIFDSYGPENMFKPFQKGDVLFTLTNNSSGLSVVWNKMQPNLNVNARGGLFVKTK